MRVCLEWLSDFIDIGDRSVENISRSLSLSGTEVERIEYPWAGLEGAVVGRIESVSVHPAGDRLLVTGVNTGERTLSIVTSDTTVKAGETVAVLPEGSLFDGKAIAAREFSGVRSEGMFLSLQELELEERSLHIMRLECARVGEDLKSLLRLDSPVIEVELTANRGDCLSMIGLAREVGAVLGLKTGRPPVENDIDTGEDPVLKVALNDTGCRRYSALLMDGVKIAPSPLWLKRRLVAAGLRPINNVVDITNYVMLETGHPIHAFDVDRIGSTKILVRNARNGEELELLDGRKVELNESDLLITNGETPLALAGIMGGEYSKIAATTE
ncbi:MAG TPA: phenylalanine--tRNA ligase beta subunit-related protein, partial [Mesotoga sp.]|nr:phenylalanine--tRNA ligase beta subunit-related protein [Mesotoga sp.]